MTYFPNQIGGGSSVGLSTGRASATGSGKLYACTDVPVVYIDNPGTSTWNQVEVAGTALGPGDIGGWTVVPSTIGMTQLGDSILVTPTTAEQGGYFKAISGFASGWVVDMAGRPLPVSGASPEVGAAVTTGLVSGTSISYFMSAYTSNASGTGVIAGSCPLGTQTRTILASTTSSIQFGSNTPAVYARLLNDGTNLFWQMSGDGEFWRSVFSEALPGSITNYGVDVTTNSGSGLSGALITRTRIRAPTTISVSNATGNGTIVTITTSAAHNLTNGFNVSVRGISVSAGAAPNATVDGTSVITVTGTTTFTFVNSNTFTYSSGGTVTNLNQ